jgi:transcription initiation factor IIE alpha subunit
MIANSLSMNEKQIRRVIGSLREAGLVELMQARQREQLSPDERRQKRALVGRLINHLQGIGAE